METTPDKMEAAADHLQQPVAAVAPPATVAPPAAVAPPSAVPTRKRRAKRHGGSPLLGNLWRNGVPGFAPVQQQQSPSLPLSPPLGYLGRGMYGGTEVWPLAGWLGDLLMWGASLSVIIGVIIFLVGGWAPPVLYLALTLCLFMGLAMHAAAFDSPVASATRALIPFLAALETFVIFAAGTPLLLVAASVLIINSGVALAYSTSGRRREIANGLQNPETAALVARCEQAGRPAD